MTTLETDRLLLRPYEAADEAAYLAMVSDPEVMRHLPGGQAMSEEQGRAAFQRRLSGADPQRRHFALVEKASGQVVGWAGLMPLEGTPDVEVYYGLRRDAWGKGYATEAARRLVRWGFEELHLPRVVAVVDPANARSVAVLHRLGMQRERTGMHYGKLLDAYATGAPRVEAPTPPQPALAWSAPPPPPPVAPAVAAPPLHAFCTSCGASLPAGAAFCPACGRPVRAAAPPAMAPPPAQAHAQPPVSEGVAVAALLLNILIWPGLGSLVAGRQEGWAQGFLFLGGFVVLFATLFLGAPLSVLMWVGAWVWGLVTGIQLLQRRA